MSAGAGVRGIAALKAEEAAVHRMRCLELVGKRFRSSRQIMRRTGWPERNTQRYLAALRDEGFVIRWADYSVGPGWLYSITDDGRRALSKG